MSLGSRSFIKATLIVLIIALCSTATAQNVPKKINFQAALTDSTGSALSGTFDITFSIYDAPTGGNQIWTETQNGVTADADGIMNVILGFNTPLSDSVFAGSARYLEIQIAGDNPMTPRSPMLAVPFSFKSSKTASLDGATGGVVTGDMVFSGGLNVVGPLETNSFKLGNGTVSGYVLMTDENGHGTWQSIPELPGTYWKLLGNGGTSASTNFLGTTDEVPLVFRVNNERALRINPIPEAEPYAAHCPSIIGGHSSNYIPASVSGGFIGGGGGYYTSTGENDSNSVLDHFGAIVGGEGNSVEAVWSFIGGGLDNKVTGQKSVISGGNANRVGGNSATIPGGQDCKAAGNYSFAAGYRAKANHDGCFVWADNTDQDFVTQDTKQFKIRAANGVIIGGGGTDGLVKLYNSTPNNVITLDALTATVTTGVLEITGGMDVAEPFTMKDKYPVGSVVVIDPDNPGHLTLSSKPYDSKVAGVISGANGIKPGLKLKQPGIWEDGQPVALNGRVYCLASAENGAIRPGDLLTTSSDPGHAMKASDPQRSYGTVIGKAMSSLDKDEGYVLVLVNLQ